MTIEQILALLTNKFSGMRKDGLAHVARLLSLQATDETEVQALVDKLDADKVTETIKEYRKVVDKEVSEATRTHETNLRKKYEFKDSGKQEGPPATPPTDIAAQIEAAMAKYVTPLQEKLAGFEGQQVTTTRLQTLEGKLKDMPTTFKDRILKDFKRMNFESDEAFTEYLTETETDIAAFNQELADKGLSQQSKPIFGQQNKDGVSSGVQSFIEAKTKPETALGGKEV